MEYVRGPDLQVRVAERGRLDADAAVRLGRDVAAALSRRAPARHPPSRRQAAEHPARPRRPRPAHRLRLGQARRAARRDRERHARRHAGLHGARGAWPAAAATPAPTSTRWASRSTTRSPASLPERPSPHLPPTRVAHGLPAERAASAVPAWLDDVVARATAAAAEDRFPTAAALDEALARPGAAPAPLVTGGGAACLLCGGPDPLALGLCPACGGSADVADTLVFLRPRAGRVGAAGGGAQARARSSPTSAGRRAAAARRRAAGVPGARAPACRGWWRSWSAASWRRARCRSHGAWGALPPKAWMLAGAAVTAGAVAGTVAMPLLLWTSPVVGSLLLLGARRTRARRWWRRRRARPRCRRRSSARVVEALVDAAARHRAEPAGRRRAGPAARCSPRSRAPATTASWRLRWTSWSTAACRAAQDLADLDENLGRFERQRERFVAGRARAARRARPVRAHPRRAGAAPARGHDRGGAAPDPARRAGRRARVRRWATSRASCRLKPRRRPRRRRRSRRCWPHMIARAACRRIARRRVGARPRAHRAARPSSIRHNAAPIAERRNHCTSRSAPPTDAAAALDAAAAPRARAAQAWLLACLLPFLVPHSPISPHARRPLREERSIPCACSLLNYEYPPCGSGAGLATAGAGRGPGLARRDGGRGDRRRACVVRAAAAVGRRRRRGGPADGASRASRRRRRARSGHARRGGLSRRRPRRWCGACSSASRYDVVHFVFSLPTAAMLPLLDLRGAPVVVSLRGSDVPGYDAAQSRRAARAPAAAPADPLDLAPRRPRHRAVREPGPAGAADRSRAPLLAVVQGGVDLARFRPRVALRRIPDGVVRCLAVARLVERNGLDDLIDALRPAGAGPLPARDRRQRPPRGRAARAGAPAGARGRRCASPAGSITPRWRGAIARRTCSPWRRGSSRSATPSSRRWPRGFRSSAARPAAFPSWSSTAATGCWCAPRRPRELAHAICYLAADPRAPRSRSAAGTGPTPSEPTRGTG